MAVLLLPILYNWLLIYCTLWPHKNLTQAIFPEIKIKINKTICSCETIYTQYFLYTPSIFNGDINNLIIMNEIMQKINSKRKKKRSSKSNKRPTHTWNWFYYYPLQRLQIEQLFYWWLIEIHLFHLWILDFFNWFR
jgi:hypothetical protein